jgi:superfamily II DNA/RNA helicase
MADSPRSGEQAPDSETIGSGAQGAPLHSDLPTTEQEARSAEQAEPDAEAAEPDAASAEPDAEAAPAPASFDDFDLPDPLRRAVAAMGWTEPSPVQTMTFELVRSGRDVLVQSQTGSGKTGAFCLPWLAGRFEPGPAAETGVQLLVLTPTRELAKQVCEQLGSLAAGGEVVALPIYGGTAMDPQLQALRKGVHAVVGTPGRILDHIRRRSLDLSRVRMVVLDEADEMLSMGFLEDIHAILEACASERQTTLFSATVPPDIERIARRYMRNPEPVRLSGDQVAAAEIDHTYYAIAGAMRVRDLVDVINLEEPTTSIVFCNTREETYMVASVLQREGFAAEALSSDLTQKARERVMGWMRSGKLRFLVATDVASRGIDISHVSHVINYTFPENAESYIHRTGRTGRAGRPGVAISLIAPQELGSFYMLRKMYPTLQFEEHKLPRAAELEAQRIETKLDVVSKLFPELVSPEWTLLARNLMKDPRGERVIAYLLSEAMSQRRRESVIEHREDEDEPERLEQRGRRGVRARGRDRDGDRERARDEGRGRDRDGDRDRGRGRRRRDDDATTRLDAEVPSEARPEASTEAALETPAHETAIDASPDTAEPITTAPAGIESTEDGEATGRRRRRRRRRGGKRSAEETGNEVDSAAEEASETDAPLAISAATQALGTGVAVADEAAAAAVDAVEGAIAPPPELPEGIASTDDGYSVEPSRRRRRRRRRRGGQGEPPQAEAEEAIDAASGGDTSDTEGEVDESSRRRKRRRRGGRRRSSSAETPVAAAKPHVSQDQIIIDIDESELEVVRDQFGEIDELDDLTLKGRRRGVIDDLQDEVELEELSEESRDDAPPAEEEDEPGEGDATSEEDEEEADEGADEGAAAAAEPDEGAKKKRRRRRRRKKKEDDAPPPELTAPPHKDFWEVWASKFTYREFEDEVWYQSHAPPPAEEPEPPAVEQGFGPAEDDAAFVSVRLSIGRKHGKKAAHIRELLDTQLGLSGRAVRNLTVGDASTRLRVSEQNFNRLVATIGGQVLDGHEIAVTLIELPPADEASASDEAAATASTEAPSESSAPEASATEAPGAEEPRPPEGSEPSETVFG